MSGDDSVVVFQPQTMQVEAFASIEDAATKLQNTREAVFSSVRGGRALARPQ